MSPRSVRSRWLGAVAMMVGAIVVITVVWKLRGPATPTRWFSRTSFWNTSIPAQPAIDRDSASMVGALSRYSAAAQLTNDHQYGIPIVTASDQDPAFSISSQVYSAGPRVVRCRIPPTAQANAGVDRHLTVVQPDGTACDFWRFQRHDGTPTAATVARPCGIVTGVAPDAWGTIPCRGRLGNGTEASGFALAGGVIRYREMSGPAPLNHALAIALPVPIVRAGPPAWPATHTDGVCPNRISCIPEGARLQLAPNFDVNAQAWPSWEKKIARALQLFGAFVVDKGGAIALSAQDTGRDQDWERLGIPVNANLGNLPWAHLRVLRLRANFGAA
jgi:hypothetical protein